MLNSDFGQTLGQMERWKVICSIVKHQDDDNCTYLKLIKMTGLYWHKKERYGDRDIRQYLPKTIYNKISCFMYN